MFETRDFWAHADDECDCGRSQWEDEISAAVDERMKRYDLTSVDSEWWRLYRMEWGNVTQGEERYHSASCIILIPQFRHFGSGLEVTWYKRVGRSTESNMSITALDWHKIVVECIESVRDDNAVE